MVCRPQELGEDIALFSCRCLRETRISFTDEDNGTEIRTGERPSGDKGGESDGGEMGGECRVDVGKLSKLLGHASSAWCRSGDPS